jgi:hypothetical protein
MAGQILALMELRELRSSWKHTKLREDEETEQKKRSGAVYISMLIPSQAGPCQQAGERTAGLNFTSSVVRGTPNRFATSRYEKDVPSSRDLIALIAS